MSQEKIIDKIKKLFALAGNNPNDNEAEVAMKMARKLLDKHNLDMYQLIDKKESVDVKLNPGMNNPWIRTVYSAIAELYDVTYLIDKNTKPNTHLLIGTESNRVTASIVATFVIDEISREYRGLGNGFRNAIANGVYEQVQEILASRKEEVMPGTGLVPADLSDLLKKDNDDWIAEMYGKIKKGARQKIAYNRMGEEIGKQMNLNAQLSNRKSLN